MRPRCCTDTVYESFSGGLVGWWFKTATEHDLADEDCGREWMCSCGPCRAAREALAKEADRSEEPEMQRRAAATRKEDDRG